MQNRWLWLILVSSLILSLIFIFPRLQIEQTNNTVQLIVDYESLEELALLADVEIDDLLRMVKEVGIDYVSLQQRNIGSYALLGEELPTHLSEYLDSNNIPIRDLVSLPAGFLSEDLWRIQQHDLQIVPRLSNAPWNIAKQLTTLRKIPTKLILFAGEDVLGYPEFLGEVSDYLSSNDYMVGTIEFSNQRGLSQFTTVENTVRVHEINPKELRNLSNEEIVSRFLRAVRERNIRVLYLRPILMEKNTVEDSVAYFSELITELENNGYQLGEAKPFAKWERWKGSFIIGWVGVIAASVILGSYLFRLSFPINLVLLLGLLGAVIGASYFDFRLTQQIMALVAAMVFPSLSIVFVSRTKYDLLPSYLNAALISLIGAVFVVNSLGETAYLVKLEEFRGVKLMHVAPIIIVFLAGILQNWDSKAILKLWNYKLPIKHLVLLGLLGLLGLFYLGRTGNFILPVSQFELAVRNWLEKTLIVRPRIKEFLFGHPLLVLALRTRKPKGWSWFFVFAVIGQLSIVNTFCHLHTPLVISLMRMAYGLILGYLFGLILFKLFVILKRWLENDTDLGILRIWQSRR